MLTAFQNEIVKSGFVKVEFSSQGVRLKEFPFIGTTTATNETMKNGLGPIHLNQFDV